MPENVTAFDSGYCLLGVIVEYRSNCRRNEDAKIKLKVIEFEKKHTGIAL